jgi:uncharacterized phage protein gp47/JayE
MSGLTSAGYTPIRSAEYLTITREAIAAELTAAGVTAEIDWSADVVLGSITSVVAACLGRLGETAQAVYDARSPNNATGAQQDDLCTIVGVSRLDATYSTAAVTLTGTSGTVIPAGAVVSGGGPDGLARWTLDASVTLASGTGSGTVTAQDVGAIVAAIGEIDAITTPVSGWTAVTNAAAAVTGRDIETDAALRLRRQQALRVAGTGSAAAMRSGLIALDFIEAAIVVENTLDVAATVSGVTLEPRSVGVILWPSSLTTAQREAVAAVIYRRLPVGIETNGAQSATVTGADGRSKTVRWAYASTLTVNVAATLVLASGYAIGDVDDLVEDAVTAYFLTATVGGYIDDQDVEEYVRAEVAGIRRITVTLNGAATVEPTANQIAAIGTITVGL